MLDKKDLLNGRHSLHYQKGNKHLAENSKKSYSIFFIKTCMITSLKKR
jgi:hypothetical protein